MEVDRGGFACPLVDAEDERVAVFGLLDGGQDYVVRADADEGVRGGESAGVGCGNYGGERVVVLKAVADGHGLLPCSGVRIKCVVEVMMAHVCIGVRPFGRAEEGEAQHIAGRVVAELALVDDAQAVASISQISPLLGWDFELRLLPAIGALSGPLDGAVGDFVGGVVALDCEREGGFEEDVGFVPVDFVVDVYLDRKSVV